MIMGEIGKTVLSGIYFLIWRCRVLLYEYRLIRQRKVDCFVVSIGNLTVGGTGKTPFTIFLATRYLAKGRRVGIVSRGYRGNYKGPVAVVSDGETIFESADVVGDEPVLMAKRLNEGDALGRIPIVVSKERFLGCQYLIDHFKVDLILLDDGFQHIRLYRDLNILLLDATEKNNALLPKGPMREPPSAIHRADVIVLTRANPNSNAMPLPENAGFSGPTLKTFFSPAELIPLEKGVIRPALVLQGETVLAFCGIGNPDSFIQMLTQLGANVCEKFFFRDHFHYRTEDIETIEKAKTARGVKWVVTTEKDAVKIEKLPGAKSDIWALRIHLAFLDPPQRWEACFFENR